MIVEKHKIKATLINLAKTSSCKKINFAAIIVSNTGYIIGLGINKPLLSSSCCLRTKIKSGTCVETCNAIHAEQAAILNSNNSEGKLYVLGIKKDGTLLNNKRFYCSVCARIIYESNITTVFLWRGGKWVELSKEQILRESYGN